MYEITMKWIKLFLIAFLFIFTFLTFVIRIKYGKVDFEQILFHIFLADFVDIFNFYLLEIILVLCIFIVLCLFTIYHKPLLKYCKIFFGFCVVFAFYLFYQMGGVAFCKNIAFENDNKIFERFYAFPDQQHYTFPKNKKNIIFIVMESMEKTFQNFQGENLTPFITNLQNENLTFYGFYPLSGTTWTIGGLAAMHNALPLKSVASVNPDGILTHALSVTDILNKNGYNTVFINGGYLSFMGKGDYLTDHGYQRLIGTDEILKIAKDINHKLTGKFSDYGLCDVDMYPFAKRELLKLSQDKKPFLMTLLTVDTHAPNGYLSDGCKTKYRDVRDAIVCADKFLQDFIIWLKQQDFYKNTVVVIVGDHLQMETKFTKELNKHKREIVTIVMNSNYNNKYKEIHKNYSTFDIAPTLLESMGIQIDGHHFGLGTSLLSDEQTMMEKITPEEFNEELLKPSLFYNGFL